MADAVNTAFAIWAALAISLPFGLIVRDQVQPGLLARTAASARSLAMCAVRAMAAAVLVAIFMAILIFEKDRQPKSWEEMDEDEQG